MKLTKRSICFKDDSCGVSWFYLHAGFLTVWFGSWTFHLFPERVFRRKFFKHDNDRYYGQLEYWGGGWLYLVCRC